MATKTAIFPGSFDPITYGHLDVIERLAKLFPQVVVLIAESSQKKSLFTVDERMSLIRESVGHLKNIQVASYKGLTVRFAKDHSPSVLVRSLRGATDFDYERMIAEANKTLAPEVETMLLFSKAEYAGVASSLVKEIAKNGGDLEKFVPAIVAGALKTKFKS